MISPAALEVLERHDPTSSHHEVVFTLADLLPDEAGDAPGR